MQQNRYSVTCLTYHLGSNTLGTRRYGIAMSIKLTSLLAYGLAPQHAMVGAILSGSYQSHADLLFDLQSDPLQSRRIKHLKYNHFRRNSMPQSNPRLVTIKQTTTSLIRNSRTYSLNLMKIYTLKMTPSGGGEDCGQEERGG